MKGRIGMKEMLRRLLMGKELRLAAQELAECAGKFEGLYEPVWLLMQDPCGISSPLGEWLTRAERIVPDSALTRYLKKLEKAKPEQQAKRLLRLICAARIRREDYADGTLTVSGLQTQAYIALDGHRVREGETLRILSAAWYQDDKIAEHGRAGEL